MRIEPLGDKVVVKRLESAEKTAGGIILPGTAQEKPAQGRVLSVGEGHRMPNGNRIAHQVSEGDRVLFSSYAGIEVRVGEKELLIMSENDILAVLE
ncbi:MAG: co-chaperone GroES [Planctomycetota bacterium]|nr:co-chaperone GroES [Planctomycetota bacterium]MDA1180395.1 co-chaperone GroES [Planctomycetota bacterium]